MVHPMQKLAAASMVVSALLSGTAAIALADAAPGTAPATVPDRPGNWWDNANQPAPGQPIAPAQAAPPRNAAPNQNFAPNAGPAAQQNNGGVTDYPANQVSDWVVANAMAARARVLQTHAESELSLLIRRLQSHFEHSSDYLNAVTAEKTAYDDYTAARDKALSDLGSNYRYHALLILRGDLDRKLLALKDDKDASRDDIVALATLKLQYGAELRDIESATLGMNGELKSARDKMVAASRHVADMKARFDDSLHDNPEVITARRYADDLRVAVVETSTLAYGASIASAAALNYSYFLHRNDNGGVYGPYGPNGVYGAYYSPYWSH